MTNQRSPFGLQPFPIALAHRGGAREAPENSRAAFEHAYELGFRYFETDVRATLDGVVMVFHDAGLSRVSDGFGRISALPYSEVKRAKISGSSPIMTLEELLQEFPDTFLNIDVKDIHTLDPFVDLVHRLEVQQRICVASFSATRLRTLRRRLGTQVGVSLAPPEILGLMAASRLGPMSPIMNLGLPPNATCVQIPMKHNGVPILSEHLIAEAHRRGLAVHVWTIDDEETMNRLLDWGVDGIMTDRPTLLKAVMSSRGYWPGD
ncbi:MAG: glycerophosphodiester phosphodiesterase [Actinomycetes bacterium]